MFQSTIYDLRTNKHDRSHTTTVAIDCEMVEVLDSNSKRKDSLGSVCVVNMYGNTIYKSYAKPSEYISDYRTRWSGLTKRLLDRAPPASQVQREVQQILEGKIIVGHNLVKDFTVLDYKYDSSMIRDSYSYPPMMLEKTINVKRKSLLNAEEISLISEEEGEILVPVKKLSAQSLKTLAKNYLGVDIQTGTHNSEEDAIASMLIYQTNKIIWEKDIIDNINNINMNSNNSKNINMNNI